MAEMSAGLVNCFCGQPRVKPPLNPSAGQFAGFAGTAAGCAKLMGSPNTAAASAAAIPNAFSFMIACSPGIISPVSSLARQQPVVGRLHRQLADASMTCPLPSDFQLPWFTIGGVQVRLHIALCAGPFVLVPIDSGSEAHRKICQQANR